MNINKKIRTNKHIIHALILLAAILIFPITVTADEPQATDLALDDSWQKGNIDTADTTHYYTFTLTQAGISIISYQGWDIENSYIEIWNHDLSKTYARGNISGSSDTSPITKSFTLAFEPGTYYIKIGGNSSNTGSYRLKGSFKKAAVSIGSNHTFDSAAKLEPNKPVTDFISEDSKTNFHKIVLTSPKCIRLIYTSYIPESCLQIWNSDYVNRFTQNIYNDSEARPASYTYEESLPAGTYYIKICPSGTSAGGQYALSYTEKSQITDITISGKAKVTAGKKLQLKASITPLGAADKTVSWKSDNTDIASVDRETGLVTAKKAGTVTITATAQGDSNISKHHTLIVTPAKMSKPSVYSPKKGKMTVSWHSQSGVSGYQIQYSTNPNFKKAKTVKIHSNKISRTISKLSVGKKYYVRIRAYYKSGKKTYYGNWSRKNIITQD